MNPLYQNIDHAYLNRLYQTLTLISVDVDEEDYEGHECIDIDDIINNVKKDEVPNK